MKFTEKYRKEEGRKRADLNMKYCMQLWGLRRMEKGNKHDGAKWIKKE